jgi:hypothetical protein
VAERVLTLRELNRTTLLRQLLLERRRLSSARAIEHLAGMQAQWSPAPYVGLWSRLEGFRAETLERAVLRGEVVKPTVMRGTLHLVTRRDYPTFFGALGPYAWWADADSAAIGARAAPAIRALYAEGPQPPQLADEYLAREHGVREENARRRAWHVARIRGHVLHAPHTALRRAAPRVAFAAVPEPAPVDATSARAELVRRYLRAFGPASRADIAAWSGMPVRDFAPALETLEPLRRFRDENGRELLDLARAPLLEGDAPTPVRFLPKWDNVLLGFDDRRRMLSDEHRRSVVMKNGDVAQTVLVDGFVSGMWRVERGRIAIQWLMKPRRTALANVADEARRLEAWL